MLEIDLSLIIITAVVFLGLVAILNSILYKPMIKFINARNEAIKNDEDSANKNVIELSIYEAEVQNILQNARNEANKIKKEAFNLSKINAIKEIEAKKTALEVNHQEFLSTLNLQKDELKANLNAKLQELKLALIKKLSGI